LSPVPPSKGDLALAKICADWPEARGEMKKVLRGWERAGYYFKLDWLLRNINTIVTGEALFAALKDVSAPQFQQGLGQAEKAINYLLNMVSASTASSHSERVSAATSSR
jgi:hypothetical protein